MKDFSFCSGEKGSTSVVQIAAVLNMHVAHLFRNEKAQNGQETGNEYRVDEYFTGMDWPMNRYNHITPLHLLQSMNPSLDEFRGEIPCIIESQLLLRIPSTESLV